MGFYEGKGPKNRDGPNGVRAVTNRRVTDNVLLLSAANKKGGLFASQKRGSEYQEKGVLMY